MDWAIASYCGLSPKAFTAICNAFGLNTRPDELLALLDVDVDGVLAAALGGGAKLDDDVAGTRGPRTKPSGSPCCGRDAIPPNLFTINFDLDGFCSGGRSSASYKSAGGGIDGGRGARNFAVGSNGVNGAVFIFFAQLNIGTLSTEPSSSKTTLSRSVSMPELSDAGVQGDVGTGADAASASIPRRMSDCFLERSCFTARSSAASSLAANFLETSL